MDWDSLDQKAIWLQNLDNPLPCHLAVDAQLCIPLSLPSLSPKPAMSTAFMQSRLQPCSFAHVSCEAQGERSS